VILMDLHMDVMDGYEATRLIRLQDTRIPIIATTADIFDAVHDRCTAVGITAVVSKPYNPDELIQKIHELLESGKPLKLSDKSPQEGAIDFENAIKRLGGDRMLYSKVLDSFLEEHSRLAQLLCKQISQGLFPDAVQTAHTLKGGCGTIGAYTAQKLAAQLQRKLEQGSAENITAQMKLFKHEFTALLATVSKLRE
jgi:two-component system, sensor histidine kinase and response regulator